MNEEKEEEGKRVRQSLRGGASIKKREHGRVKEGHCLGNGRAEVGCSELQKRAKALCRPIGRHDARHDRGAASAFAPRPQWGR